MTRHVAPMFVAVAVFAFAAGCAALAARPWRRKAGR